MSQIWAEIGEQVLYCSLQIACACLYEKCCQ